MYSQQLTVRLHNHKKREKHHTEYAKREPIYTNQMTSHVLLLSLQVPMADLRYLC